MLWPLIVLAIPLFAVHYVIFDQTVFVYIGILNNTLFYETASNAKESAVNALSLDFTGGSPSDPTSLPHAWP